MSDAVIIALCVSAIVICLFLGMALLLLKVEIKDWMRRTTKAGPLELGPTSTQQQAAAAAEHTSDRALVPIVPPDPSVAQWQTDVEDAVRGANIPNKDELISQLKAALAMTRRAADFNVAARLIFGTQIAVLHNAQASTDGLTLDDLRPIFGEHVMRLLVAGDARTPDILQWVDFLVGQRLIVLRDARYRITEAGRVFLTFITSIGMNETKAF